MGLGEGDELFLGSLGQVREFPAGADFEVFEALHGQGAVGGAGERQDGLCHFRVCVDGGPAVRGAAEHHAVGVAEPLQRALEFVGDVLDREAQFLGQRPDGGQLFRDGSIVPLHHRENGHVLPRHRGDGRVPPVPDDPAGLGELAGSVVLQRHAHEVPAHTQMGLSHPGELLGQQVEQVEIRLCLPRRVDRGGEGMHKRMHVGGGQIVLFVPRGSREHDVGQQRGGGHPEVRGDQQVQLSLRRLLMPFHVLGLEPFGVVLAQDIVMGAQQVPQEVLIPLGRGAEQVGAPQHEGPRPVFRGIDVLDRRVQGTVLERVGDVAGGVLRGAGGDGGLCFVREVQRVPVELRVERHPTEPGGLGQGIRRVHPVQGSGGERGFQRISRVAVLAPLIRVHVPVAGADHGPGRPGPVQGVGQGHPSGGRAGLFLSHVVRPAATVAAHAAGQHDEGQDRPVSRVAMEPLADSGAHDDHRAALGLLRVAGELAGHPGAGLGWDGRNLFLPSRGVRRRGVLVAGGPLTWESFAADAVLGQHEVEYGGDQLAFHLDDRHAAAQHATRAVRVLEARQQDLRVLPRDLAQRQRRLDPLEVQVPFALAAA